MPIESTKMPFTEQTRRLDAHGSEAKSKYASIVQYRSIWTAGCIQSDGVAACRSGRCMIKGIEWVVPNLKFWLLGVKVRVLGVRQNVPPRTESVAYEILVDTDENVHQLILMHDNREVLRHGVQHLAGGNTDRYAAPPGAKRVRQLEFAIRGCRHV